MNQSTEVVSLKESHTGPQHSTTKQLISFHALLFLSALNSAEQNILHLCSSFDFPAFAKGREVVDAWQSDLWTTAG
jgi:hypothetical protein